MTNGYICNRCGHAQTHGGSMKPLEAHVLAKMTEGPVEREMYLCDDCWRKFKLFLDESLLGDV